jgi:aromatic acid exporter family member 1
MGTSTTMNRRAMVQAFKGALAAVLAWLLAAKVLGLPQPFLAPYAAVLMIESTVYRSIRGSAQQLASAGSAVLLAFLASRLVPDTAAALGVAVFLGAVLGRWSVFGDSGKWIGVTTVLVLTVSGAAQDFLLVDRLGETALGAVVGTAVNALLLPPTYARWARDATADLTTELRTVLKGLANVLRSPGEPEGAHAWVRRSRKSEELVRHAQEAVEWSNEADRLNLRRRHLGRHDPAVSLRAVWPRLVQIAEAVRSCADQGSVTRYPSTASLTAYAAVLDDLADAVDLAVERGEAFDEVVTRTCGRIERLDDRLTSESHENPSEARGLSTMLLPARLALDTLAESPVSGKAG